MVGIPHFRERVGRKIYYNQPAGHLEPDEILIKAAIRETLEESAYEFRPLILIGIYPWTALKMGTLFTSLLRKKFLRILCSDL